MRKVGLLSALSAAILLSGLGVNDALAPRPERPPANPKQNRARVNFGPHKTKKFKHNRRG